MSLSDIEASCVAKFTGKMSATVAKAKVRYIEAKIDKLEQERDGIKTDLFERKY